MTTLPFLSAYAGIPYQVFGERSGALALTISWMRSAITRSASGISLTLASRTFSPSALRASAFSSAARSRIAARSSAENVWDFLVLFPAAFFSAIGQLLDADEVARRVAKGAVAD